jgi:mutator protein MutT
VIQVAAAIIENGQSQILLAQRAEPDSLKGLWEFPGGQIEVGESPEQAVIREIQEELALEISIERLLGHFSTQFPGGAITIQAFVAKSARLDFRVIDHLDVRWVGLDEIREYTLVPADIPVLQAYLDSQKSRVEFR